MSVEIKTLTGNIFLTEENFANFSIFLTRITPERPVLLVIFIIKLKYYYTIIYKYNYTFYMTFIYNTLILHNKLSELCITSNWLNHHLIMRTREFDMLKICISFMIIL